MSPISDQVVKEALQKLQEARDPLQISIGLPGDIQLVSAGQLKLKEVKALLQALQTAWPEDENELSNRLVRQLSAYRAVSWMLLRGSDGEIQSVARIAVPWCFTMPKEYAGNTDYELAVMLFEEVVTLPQYRRQGNSTVLVQNLFEYAIPTIVKRMQGLRRKSLLRTSHEKTYSGAPVGKRAIVKALKHGVILIAHFEDPSFMKRYIASSRLYGDIVRGGKELSVVRGSRFTLQIGTDFIAIRALRESTDSEGNIVRNISARVFVAKGPDSTSRLQQLGADLSAGLELTQSEDEFFASISEEQFGELTGKLPVLMPRYNVIPFDTVEAYQAGLKDIEAMDDALYEEPENPQTRVALTVR